MDNRPPCGQPGTGAPGLYFVGLDDPEEEELADELADDELDEPLELDDALDSAFAAGLAASVFGASAFFSPLLDSLEAATSAFAPSRLSVR